MLESEKDLILPQSLLNKILASSKDIRQAVEKTRTTAKKMKIKLRDTLAEKGFLKKLPFVNQSCEVTGIDGTYFVDSLLANEVITVVSVGVKGLTPHKKHTSKEREDDYISKLYVENHTGFAHQLAVSLMSMFEVILACESKSNVVLLDGSAFTPLLNLANVFNHLPFQKVSQTSIFGECEKTYETFRSVFKNMFENGFSENVFCYVTKHVTSKNLMKMLGLGIELNDRALSTLILEEGEYLKMPKTKKTGSLKVLRPKTRTIDDYSAITQMVETVFFKPRNDMPALKVDVPAWAHEDGDKFISLLNCLRNQCVGSGILEPYPLYIAHVYCSSIRDACLASRQMATLESVKNLGVEDNELFLHFYSFRTLGGD